MLLGMLSALLTAGCLSAAPLRLPDLEGALPQDVRGSFSLQASAASVPSVPGVPLDLSVFGMSIGPAVRVPDPPPMRGSQAVRVDLAALLNRHIKGAGSIGSGPEKFFLGTQVDLKGEVYLSVQGEEWPVPYFFPIEAGMDAHWQSSAGRRYRASIDGSIFRRKFNNYLVIDDEAAEKRVFKRRLSDFFYSAYRAGAPAAIGGSAYRIFLSYVVDASRSPAVFDQSAFGVCLLHDESDDPAYHDIQPYPFPLSAVKGERPAAFRFHGGQTLYFRLEDEGRTLVVSD